MLLRDWYSFSGLTNRAHQFGPPLRVSSDWRGHTVRMPFDVVSAVVAGVAAAQVMEGPAYLQKALHLPLRQDVFAEAGILLRARSARTRLVGYAGHAVLAAVIACAYAGFFHAVGEERLLAWGLLGGLIHFLIGGAVIATLFPVLPEPAAQPDLQGASRGWLSGPHPGFAYRKYGARDVLSFLGGHLVFGSLLGVAYPALHPSLTLAAAW